MIKMNKQFLAGIGVILLFGLVLLIIMVGFRGGKEKGQSGSPLSTSTASDILPGPLSPEKEKLRQALIAPFAGQAGTVVDTPDYRIDYLPAGPVFQVEIKTVYVIQAQKEAINWLKAKGFSEEDICNLPLAFYLGFGPAQKLRGSGLSVSPKPDFCH
jgi:hypothetical protein